MQTVNHWSADQAQIKLFRDTLRGYVIRRDLVPFSAEDTVIEGAVNEIIQSWFNAGGSWYPYADFQAAVDACLFHYDHVNPEKPAASLTQRLTVSITRQVGTESITLGLSAEYEITSAAALRAAYDELRLSIGHQFSLIAPLAPSTVNAVNGAVSQQPLPEPDDNFSASRISVSIVAGKRYYRVHGGRWEKFGVPIYEEILLPAGFVPAMIPDGGVALAGIMARAKMEGGKPKKVLELKKL